MGLCIISIIISTIILSELSNMLNTIADLSNDNCETDNEFSMRNFYILNDTPIKQMFEMITYVIKYNKMITTGLKSEFNIRLRNRYLIEISFSLTVFIVSSIIRSLGIVVYTDIIVLNLIIIIQLINVKKIYALADKLKRLIKFKKSDKNYTGGNIL